MVRWPLRLGEMNLRLASRALVLFSAGISTCHSIVGFIAHDSSLGTALVLALNLLQVHRREPGEGTWLAVPLLAAAATVVGLLYPVALGHSSAPDGSTVMRCLAVFVGIYQATTVSHTLFNTTSYSSITTCIV